jgi:hypothetical protein
MKRLDFHSTEGVGKLGSRARHPRSVGEARPSFKQPVQEEFTYRKLRFPRHGTRVGKLQLKGEHCTLISTKTGKVQWRGEQRTFITTGLGVLQRAGGKAKSTATKLIYTFERRPHLKALLDFTETAVRTFSHEWELQFRQTYNRKRRQ